MEPREENMGNHGLKDMAEALRMSRQAAKI